MGSGFSKMKKQARQMQEQYGKMREEMETKEVTGVSGNGLVTVVLTGARKMKSIKIKPDCVNPSDVEGLEDLIRDAYEKASAQIEKEEGGLENMMGF